GGREFEATDQTGSPPVVIVNETLARRYWPHEDPIGKTLWLGCDVTRPRIMAEVTGVAKDAKYGSLDEQPQPFVYGPLAQNWVGFVALIVETSGDPGALTAGLRGLMRGPGTNLWGYELGRREGYSAGALA